MDAPTRDALDVGGVGGLELEARVEVACRIPRTRLLSRWAVRMAALGGRGGGLGLAYFGLADLGRVSTLLGVGRANVPDRTWSPEAGQLSPRPGGYSGILEHPSGRSLVRHVHKRYLIINVTRLSGDSGRACLFIGDKEPRTEGRALNPTVGRCRVQSAMSACCLLQGLLVPQLTSKALTHAFLDASLIFPCLPVHKVEQKRRTNLHARHSTGMYMLQIGTIIVHYHCTSVLLLICCLASPGRVSCSRLHPVPPRCRMCLSLCTAPHSH